TSGISCSRRSIGIVTRCSTSCADAPGMLTNTSSIGTTICGSSSRGVCQMLKSPNNNAATITSGVSGESINECAIFPANSRFTNVSPHPWAMWQLFFHPVLGCQDSAPRLLRHSAQTTLQPDCLYFFQASRRASGSGPSRPPHKFPAIGRGSPGPRPATQGPVSLLVQNTPARTCRTELQTLWASPHAPSRCAMPDRLLPQPPPLFPSETSPAIHPTALAPRHFSSRLRALRRVTWLPVGSATCPPPRTAAFPAIPSSPAPPSAESLFHRTEPQFVSNRQRCRPHVPRILPA